MHRFGQIFGVVQSEITISIKIKKKKKGTDHSALRKENITFQ